MIWNDIYAEEFYQPYMRRLSNFIIDRRKIHKVYPKTEDVFKAFSLTPFEDVKVVIVGQDPYHTPDVAHGLAFSSAKVSYIPPSLRIIFREIGSAPRASLVSWAEQGVLLLNRILTVEKGKALSHANKGWEQFTRRILTTLGETLPPKVFLLWGSQARSCKTFIDISKHYVLEANHPASEIYKRKSFIGCGHFKKTNELMNAIGNKQIEW